MARLFAVKSALFAALGAAVLLVSPATALAANTAPVAIANSSTTQLSYVITYPDTQAGLNSCGDEGYSLFHKTGSKVSGWECLENNPYAGWNLWIFWSNNNCNTCVGKI
jgi:opacity protein-like surface antigen